MFLIPGMLDGDTMTPGRAKVCALGEAGWSRRDLASPAAAAIDDHGRSAVLQTFGPNTLRSSVLILDPTGRTVAEHRMRTMGMEFMLLPDDLVALKMTPADGRTLFFRLTDGKRLKR